MYGMCNYIIFTHTIHIVWIQVCTVCVYNYIIITHTVHIVWMGTGVCVCVWYMFEGAVCTCVEV